MDSFSKSTEDKHFTRMSYFRLSKDVISLCELFSLINDLIYETNGTDANKKGPTPIKGWDQGAGNKGKGNPTCSKLQEREGR